MSIESTHEFKEIAVYFFIFGCFEETELIEIQNIMCAFSVQLQAKLGIEKRR